MPADASSFSLLPGEIAIGSFGTSAQHSDTTLKGKLSRQVGLPSSDEVAFRNLHLVVVDNSADGVREYTPWVLAERLKYNHQSAQFTGRAFVGLRGVVLTAAESLTTPIGFTLTTDGDSISPTLINFLEGNGRPVEVVLYTEHSVDSIAINVHSYNNPNSKAHSKVALPSVLRFQQPPRKLQGLGFERRRITLSMAGARILKALDVSIDADNGVIEPASVRLEPGASTTLTLVTSSLDSIRLSASAQSVDGRPVFPALVIIESAPPYRSALAIIVGAFLGALTAYLSLSGRKKPVNWRMAAAAMLGGLLGAAIYIGLGVNLTRISFTGPLSTWMALLGFSAGGAAFGLSVAFLTEPETQKTS